MLHIVNAAVVPAGAGGVDEAAGEVGGAAALVLTWISCAEAGTDADQLARSAQLEGFKARGVEVGA